MAMGPAYLSTSSDCATVHCIIIYYSQTLKGVSLSEPHKYGCVADPLHLAQGSGQFQDYRCRCQAIGAVPWLFVQRVTLPKASTVQQSDKTVGALSDRGGNANDRKRWVRSTAVQ